MSRRSAHLTHKALKIMYSLRAFVHTSEISRTPQSPPHFRRCSVVALLYRYASGRYASTSSNLTDGPRGAVGMAVERRGEPEGLVLGVASLSPPPLQQGQLEPAPNTMAPSRALEPAPIAMAPSRALEPAPALLGEGEGERGLGCGVLLPVALGTALGLSAGGGL